MLDCLTAEKMASEAQKDLPKRKSTSVCRLSP